MLLEMSVSMQSLYHDCSLKEICFSLCSAAEAFLSPDRKAFKVITLFTLSRFYFILTFFFLSAGLNEMEAEETNVFQT